MDDTGDISAGSFFLGAIIALTIFFLGFATGAKADGSGPKCLTLEAQTAYVITLGAKFKVEPRMFVAPEGSGLELAGHDSFFMVFQDDSAVVAYVRRDNGCVNVDAVKVFLTAEDWKPILENIYKLQKDA